MVIHHDMIVRTSPERVFHALTQPKDLSTWMAAPTAIDPPGQAAVGSVIAFQYGPQRSLIVQVTAVEMGRLLRWQISQPMWQRNQPELPQTATWTLTPYESSTLVDLRVDGWDEEEEAYASVSYKWASFMMRLKMYLGDLREIVDMLGTIEQRVREKNAAEGDETAGV